MTILTKTVLNSEAIPKVALNFMNDTHIEEVEMVKTLGECISFYQINEAKTDKAEQEITQLLANWLQHTQAHFSRENELMEETHFPMYPVHSAEHERVLAEMTTIIQQWQQAHDIEQLADYVFSAWPNWFNEHVNSMDRVTAQFAAMNGYEG